MSPGQVTQRYTPTINDTKTWTDAIKMGTTDELEAGEIEEGNSRQRSPEDLPSTMDELSPRLQGISLGLENNQGAAGQTVVASGGHGRNSKSGGHTEYGSYRPANDRNVNTSQEATRKRSTWKNKRGNNYYRPHSKLPSTDPSLPNRPSVSWENLRHGQRHTKEEKAAQDEWRRNLNATEPRSQWHGNEHQNTAQGQHQQSHGHDQTAFKQHNSQSQDSQNYQYNVQAPPRMTKWQAKQQQAQQQKGQQHKGQQEHQQHKEQQGQWHQRGQQNHGDQFAGQQQQHRQWQQGQWQGQYNGYNTQGYQQQTGGQWPASYGQYAQPQGYYGQGNDSQNNQNKQPVQFPISYYPCYPYYPAYSYQQPVTPAAQNTYQVLQVGYNAPNTLPGGGVSLPTQSQQKRSGSGAGIVPRPATYDVLGPVKHDRKIQRTDKKNRKNALAMRGQGHQIYEQASIASVLLDPNFAAAPSSPSDSRAMHSYNRRSPAKSPNYHGDAKIYNGPAPQPTEQYLAQAAKDPERALAPLIPHRLLILDLNGTLVHRPDKRNLTRIIPRPFLAPFLQFIFDNFAVMVWSSARPDNVNLMVHKVLGSVYSPKLIAKWNRNNFGLTAKEYTQNVQVYKQLTRVWSDEKLCGKPSMWGQHNTILLDDTLLKAAAEPHNIIEIPEFTATLEQMKSDTLREVAGYLDELSHQVDISAFMKKRPFKADGTWNMNWSEDSVDGGVNLEA